MVSMCVVPKEQLTLVEELKEELQKVKSGNLLMECRIREEVTNDFSELFTQMEADFRCGATCWLISWL